MDEVVIIGAGLAGLATAALLNLLCIHNIILDKNDSNASYWKLWTYERLKLDLAQFFCSNPGVPDPATSLQGKDITRHRGEYERHLKLHPVYGQHYEGVTYDEESKLWRILVSNSVTGEVEERRARFIVIATTKNNKWLVPDHPGLENFTGEIIHARDYRDGSRYAGKRVLVIGIGRSVMEIALNLRGFGVNPTFAFSSPFFKVILNVENKAVTFWNGTSAQFDVIILVTETIANVWQQVGYPPYQNGWHAQIFPPFWKGQDGLYYAGLYRGLAAALIDALNIANDIKMIYRNN